MFKLKHLAIVIGAFSSAHAMAEMNIQPDPTNPIGYVVSKADILASEQAKTSDPMYDTWAKALQTRLNSVVEAIVPGSSSNPENVKRVERVFSQSDWDYMTKNGRARVHIYSLFKSDR